MAILRSNFTPGEFLAAKKFLPGPIKNNKKIRYLGFDKD